MIQHHPSYQYAQEVLSGKINAPKYVVLQCEKFKQIADGEHERFFIDEKKISLIEKILKLLIMPKGLKAGKSVFEAVAGFQWLFYIAVFCTVYRDNPKRRKYENVILEICRKNGKTFLVAVTFILLYFLEPRFSKFYSVAPDGLLSREVKNAIEEIIKSSPALEGKFKILRSNILCKVTDNDYIPLNYSKDRLDGKLPAVFLVDEAGALPEAYAIESMRSGQLTILNKLGYVISTKYPKFDNPFEDEVSYAKNVLDGVQEDEALFALLYEPDNPKEWATDNGVLEQANPLSLEMPEVMEDLLQKRAKAIAMPSRRENFLTKHCNILYMGAETESYVDVADVQAGKVDSIDWMGREVFVGLDLGVTDDNCAVAMVAEDDGEILAEVVAFVPEDKVPEKSRVEKVDYPAFIRAGKCVDCGSTTVDYLEIEERILGIEEQYGVKVVGVAYDRYNCLATAMRLERAGLTTVEVKQHSSVLHPAIKLLKEKILNHEFHYEENKLLEINFQNARCTYDTNLNQYVNKKRSAGKIDMVMALIDAVYLMQQTITFGTTIDWGCQVF